MLRIALDYDETITADPVLWSLFITLAHHLNHEVVIVTYRTDICYTAKQNQDIEDFATNHGGLQIVYTAGKQKASMVDADIWIDDRPELIPTPDILIGMVEGCRRNGE